MRQMSPALAPGQLVDADVQRLVDAFRPVAAAARLQLEQVGVEVLDVGGEVECLGDVFVADVAIGDEAHADFGVGIGVDDRGGDRPDLALGALDQRPIEPVVSSTNATSTMGRAIACDGISEAGKTRNASVSNARCSEA